MNAAGSPLTGNGSGNGNAHRTNSVRLTRGYIRDRELVEAQHPRVAREQLFAQIEAFMVICDVDEVATRFPGAVPTYHLVTPAGFEPQIHIYFTYAHGQVVMRAAHAPE